VSLPGGASVSLNEIVQALNALGVTPRDLIAVFEAMREAGALQAELVVM
jgi:flagellar P-ring protein precursor FlgI